MARDPLLAFIVARSRLGDRPLELADVLDDPADPIVLVTGSDGELAFTRGARQLAQELRTGRIREPTVRVVHEGETASVARSTVRRADGADAFEIRVVGGGGLRPGVEGALRGNALLLRPEPFDDEPGEAPATSSEARYRCDLNRHLVWRPKGSQHERCPVDDHGRRCRGELTTG